MSEKYILLAEDNSDDVALTERALYKCRIPNKLVIVSDGKEALDYLFCRDKYAGGSRCEKPSVVLMDLKLPFIDGLEALRQIRQDPETCSIPVIILTSSIDEKDRQESLRLGANSFLCKPVSFDKFVELIRKLCDEWLNPD